MCKHCGFTVTPVQWLSQAESLINSKSLPYELPNPLRVTLKGLSMFFNGLFIGDRFLNKVRRLPPIPPRPEWSEMERRRLIQFLTELEVMFMVHPLEDGHHTRLAVQKRLSMIAYALFGTFQTGSLVIDRISDLRCMYSA